MNFMMMYFMDDIWMHLRRWCIIIHLSSWIRIIFLRRRVLLRLTSINWLSIRTLRRWVGSVWPRRRCTITAWWRSHSYSNYWLRYGVHHHMILVYHCLSTRRRWISVVESMPSFIATASSSGTHNNYYYNYYANYNW
jgi:hypothetical protein